eukprot:CAMPEP_0114591350 /NCGR_PEP_ID=MMETSP0125-20121206/13410_1 /TAXON_ID=485358 ORGANISM="Aristerostoma sp., Strain ATCC 50986" /NCGR_SAMPLE_ID=MMETSP0125 /ASSEMBLY_ACC=CAM_ASM_000245 /LENGTH=33 /DNA_ID= /DNA_START= /DNA_END= /DNA_ORIENTATION=
MSDEDYAKLYAGLDEDGEGEFGEENEGKEYAKK